MFDRDSNFTKGFETGILLRSRNEDPTIFGCKPIEFHERNELQQTIFNSVRVALDTVKSMQESDLNNKVIFGLDEMIIMINELSNFVNAFDPEEQIDPYCRGMSFGLTGSKILVKVANTILNTKKHAIESNDEDYNIFDELWRCAVQTVANLKFTIGEDGTATE